MFKKEITSKVVDETNLKLIEQKRIDIENLKQKLNKFIQEKNKIQNNFNFVIPDYIIDEIIKVNENKLSLNLCCLINCAVVNGHLSKKNGNVLKQTYLY